MKLIVVLGVLALLFALGDDSFGHWLVFSVAVPAVVALIVATALDRFMNPRLPPPID